MSEISADPRSTTTQTGLEVWRRHALEHQVEQTVNESAPPLSARQRFIRRFKRQRGGLIALGFLVFITLVAILAPLIAPYDPDENDLRSVFSGPTGDHLLGTDQNGRDTLSRLIFGARVSLMAAVQAVGIAIALGLVPGLLAGYFGRWVDMLLMRLTDAILTFPPLLLAMAIVGVLGPGLRNAMLAVGVVFAPRFARLVRGLVLAVREETFIEASKTIGTPTSRILRQHVVPNILSPIVVQISLALGFAMLAEAALSFLGLGVTPPQSSWGSMLQAAYRSIGQSTFAAIPPGVAIMLTVLAFNLLGDGVRDSLGREIRRG